MKIKPETQQTVEVIEKLQEEQIDKKVVRWFAREGRAPDSKKALAGAAAAGSW